MIIITTQSILYVYSNFRLPRSYFRRRRPVREKPGIKEKYKQQKGKKPNETLTSVSI